MNTVYASKQQEAEIVYQKSTENSQTHSSKAVFLPEGSQGRGVGGVNILMRTTEV